MCQTIVNKYNNTVHRIIKMKPIDVIGDSVLNTMQILIKKDSKLKAGDHVRISKYKNIFAKGYALNWSEENFVVSKIRSTVVSDLNGEEITGSFYEKELQNTNQKEFRIEKVLKKERDKLYVKWKGYHNRFNSWIDKKDLI